jgi:1,4-alpha-glucan branching enzyme
MSAPAKLNDGMGSLLYSDGTCRFRVWAPFAQSVQVMGDFTSWNSAPINLASEGSTGNWSADGIPVVAGQMYKYLITNQGGANNDNSQVWQRTDARALQVQSSDPASAGYVVAPFPSARQAFTTPAFQNFLIYQLHIGSYSGRNDQVAVQQNTATFLDLIDKLEGLDLTQSRLFPLRMLTAMWAVQARVMVHPTCLRRKMNMLRARNSPSPS